MSDLAQLRIDCALAAKFFNRMFSGLLLASLRSHGPSLLDSLWAALLRNHQDRYFLAGLGKLGITEETPARAAAMYHYFSNALGGLGMQYIEESPTKVWIRYLAPSWTYPGTALHAVPKGVRRTVFSTWHPRNGELMGCLRLGWVCTKLIDEGDPYDEGFFVEHERDLSPEERVRFERHDVTPEFDPAKAPRLNTSDWPEARLLKANRNYSGEYVRDAIDQLYGLVGMPRTHEIVEHTMRVLASQYIHEFAVDLKQPGTDAETFARLHGEIRRTCGTRCEVGRVSSRSWQLTIAGTHPFSAPSEDLSQALFEFQVNSARILNGHLRVTREPGLAGERWTVEDTGRWLW